MTPQTLIGPLGPSAWVYGAAYALGILVFYLAARRRGLDTDGIALVAAAGLLGGLFGALVFQFLATAGAQPGKSVLGGIAGGYGAVAWTKARLGIRRPTGDLFALALMAGEALGRWGCLLGGCCYGKVAVGLPWAVWQHGAWRHPAQVYLSLACAAVFVVLLVLERRGDLPENGLWIVQGILYCPARFAVEFFRAGDTLALGLTTAQWACVGGLAFFVWRGRKLGMFL